MFKKYFITAFLMLNSSCVFAAPDVNQLADTHVQEAVAISPAAQPAESTVLSKVKTVGKSCLVGAIGACLGLIVKATSFDSIKNDPQYGTILNGLAGLIIAKCGSNVVKNVFDEFQSNVFMSAMALGYVLGETAPNSVVSRIDSKERVNASHIETLSNARWHKDPEWEERAIANLSKESAYELVDRQHWQAQVKRMVKKPVK